MFVSVKNFFSGWNNFISVSDLCILCQESRLRSAARGNFQVPGTNLKLTTGPFSVAGPRHYNTLPTWLRQAGSRATFCNKLKTHFLISVTTRHNVYECYCVLHLLGFIYFMSVRRRWAPVRGALSSLLWWWWWRWWWWWSRKTIPVNVK